MWVRCSPRPWVAAIFAVVIYLLILFFRHASGICCGRSTFRTSIFLMPAVCRAPVWKLPLQQKTFTKQTSGPLAARPILLLPDDDRVISLGLTFTCLLGSALLICKSVSSPCSPPTQLQNCKDLPPQRGCAPAKQNNPGVTLKLGKFALFQLQNCQPCLAVCLLQKA